MLIISDKSHGNIIGLEFSGKATKQDYIETLIPTFNRVIAEHGKARVLFDFGSDFSGYEFAAMIEDARFGFRHINHFEKVGTINASAWIKGCIIIFGKLIKSQCRNFDDSQREDAWSWIES